MSETIQNELTPITRAKIAAEALLRLEKAARMTPLPPATCSQQDTGLRGDTSEGVTESLAVFSALRTMEADRAVWAALYGIRLFEAGSLADEGTLAEYFEHYRKAAQERLGWAAALAVIEESGVCSCLTVATETFPGLIDGVLAEASAARVDCQAEVAYLRIMSGHSEAEGSIFDALESSVVM